MQTTNELSQYKLPPLVEDIKQGWITSAQAITFVTGLFAAVEACILGILVAQGYPNQVPGNPCCNSTIIDPTANNLSTMASPDMSGTDKALRIFVYGGLTLNLAGAFCALVMLDCLGELTYQAWQIQNKSGNTIVMKQGLHSPEILELYGMDQKWMVSKVYASFCSMLGTLFIFLQLGVYVWTHEPDWVKVVTLILLILGGLPMVHFISHSWRFPRP